MPQIQKALRTSGESPPPCPLHKASGTQGQTPVLKHPEGEEDSLQGNSAKVTGDFPTQKQTQRTMAYTCRQNSAAYPDLLPSGNASQVKTKRQRHRNRKPTSCQRTGAQRNADGSVSGGRRVAADGSPQRVSVSAYYLRQCYNND